MGRLSNDEWSTAAWKSAAETHGRKNAGWYSAMHYAPHFGIAAVVGALGFGAWWLFTHARAALAGAGEGTAPAAHATAGVPIWIWLAGAILAVVTVVAYRPGRIPAMGGAVFAKAAIVTGLWLLLAGVFLSQL
jgi:hypothetical protein